MAGPKGVSWSDLPPEQAEQLRRANRRRRKLQQLGKPSLVPSGPSIARLRLLHDEYGMTFQAIADAAPTLNGVPFAQSTASELYRGRRSPGKGGNAIEKVPRTTQDRIFAIEVPATPLPSQAFISAVGTQRRLQALMCIGFGTRYVAEYLGHTDWNMVWRLTKNKASKGHTCQFVHASTRDKVAELYDKLAFGADPADHGISAIGIGKTKSAAARHGYAPPACWDADTIDDPDALPEWTGACGTEEGYKIHIRESLYGRDLPICDRCRDVVETVGVHAFDREAFNRIMEEKGLTAKRLSARVWGYEGRYSAIYRFKRGEAVPMSMGIVHMMANALGVPVGELLLDRDKAPVRFNPYVLKVALEEKDLSYRQAASLPGSMITQETVGKWLRGQTTPSDPKKLKPIAQLFGLKPEVFYT